MARPRRKQAQSALGLAALAAFVVLTGAPRRAPAGTVAEQRARLPPPVQCEDPLEGIWKSHDYRQGREWTVFTLEIRRVAGTEQLRGSIRNETWYGEPDRSEPGPCEGERHYVISMDAEGRMHDGQLEFGAVGAWRLDALPCGEHGGRYNLDHFSGRLDPELLEFQSVNNDGGAAVDEPTVFRRVECLPQAKADQPQVVVVTPPAFYPPEDEAGGCASR